MGPLLLVIAMVFTPVLPQPFAVLALIALLLMALLLPDRFY